MRTLLLSLFAVLLLQAAEPPAARSASTDELLVAWWGDMRSIFYPVTEPNTDAIDSVREQLHIYRTDHPDALLLDVGGFVGPTVTAESSYDLPPISFYQDIGVSAVNVSQGDWSWLLPADKILEIPKPETPALLSTGRMAEGSTPQAIDTAVVARDQAPPVIVAGATRLEALDYSPTESHLLEIGADPASVLRPALEPLQAQYPNAITILLADLSPEDAESLAVTLPGIDLVLVNRAADKPKPRKIGESTWIVERFPPGILATGRLALTTDGTIRDIEIGRRDLLPVKEEKGGLLVRLGLKSPPKKTFPISQPPPKPIIAINLKDPVSIVESMGYTNPVCEARRCPEVPDTLRDRIANRWIVGFDVRVDGVEIGRLYRVHREIPERSLNLIVNLILDTKGRIVRAAPKIEPVIAMRYILLSEILKDWEGLTPAEIQITPEKYPGIEAPLELLKQDFELAAEIHQHCP